MIILDTFTISALVVSVFFGGFVLLLHINKGNLEEDIRSQRKRKNRIDINQNADFFGNV
jgi:hypothetical protein